MNTYLRLTLDVSRSKPDVAGEIATVAAEKASANAPAIPVADPSIFKDPNDLSFLQKQLALLTIYHKECLLEAQLRLL